MADPRTFRLRVRYAKTGRLAMLSHLEVTHALERIVRRSGLPFALSQGFSPHMKLAFGPALPVGVGGLEEVFDVTLVSYVAAEKALVSLQEAAPPDLWPEHAAYVEPASAAASVAFTVSTYEVELDRALRQLIVPDQVTVVRKGKEKVLQVADFLVGEPAWDGRCVRFTLRSGEAGSLRADAFARECLKLSAQGREPFQIRRFMRTALA